ncbi:sulfite oxidase isoform X4 [Leptinotarsa decemlineata]|uniref:sulfite oxidase isoform X4 n=1 Tax=Leptinotarsa decemlineata TaxID=7539 RepID=UPI003D30B42F
MQSLIRRIAANLSIYRTSYQAIQNINDSRHEKKYHRHYSHHFNTKNITYTAVGTCLGYCLYKEKKGKDAEGSKGEDTEEPNKNEIVAGKFTEKLPFYSVEEISRHTTMKNGVWVIYKEGVYDITDFIIEHPGGDQIFMAAGSSIEPFFYLHRFHESPHVYEILEKYRIGNLQGGNMHITDDLVDPYDSDPRRHPDLKPLSLRPFNGNCEPSELVEQFITPNELFYVRNHLPVPLVTDPCNYEIEVVLEGKDETFTFTLDELKKLPKHTIVAGMMCSGNRRTEMSKVKRVLGLMWGIGGMSNATWTGVPLRQVLNLAKLDENDTKYKHIQFEGIDADVNGKPYSASIPIWKGTDKRGDVLLAYEMNGEPLPRDHGYPLRVLVPGVAGARSVKWLTKIIVSANESDSHYQLKDYKGYSPSTYYNNVDYTKSPAIQELPVTSAICKPSENDTVQVNNGTIPVKGYAYSGGGQKIVRVDVTADGGKSWHVADLGHQDTALPPQHWAWTIWSVSIPVKKDQKKSYSPQFPTSAHST